MPSQFSAIVKDLAADLAGIQFITPETSQIILTFFSKILSKINLDFRFLPKKLMAHILSNILYHIFDILYLFQHFFLELE
jgi:hypothetical protein